MSEPVNMSGVASREVRVGIARSIPLPAYETSGAAGMDVAANFPESERAAGLSLDAGQRALVPTGLIFEIPVGYEIQVRPRSGLALKFGITLVNSPGTIDSDYRGEVGVILQNTGEQPFQVEHGARIAQLVLAPVNLCIWVEGGVGTTSTRGSGGFGSTGV